MDRVHSAQERSIPNAQADKPALHSKGLRRGYADKVRVDFDGSGSYITLLNGKKRPIAIVLGEYIPGEIDARMDADATLFAAAGDLLVALKAMVVNDSHTYRDCHKAALKAIARATGEA